MKPNDYLANYGPKLLRQGYSIIPIRPGYKFPKGLEGWQTINADQAQLDKWLGNGFSEGGVGVLTRRTPAIDLDVLDDGVIAQLEEWITLNIGETVCRVGQAPKRLLVFRTDNPFTKVRSKTYVDMFGQEHHIEILADGQQFVAFATHPDTNAPYQWVSEKSLAEIDHDQLPTLSHAQAIELVEFFETILPIDWEEKPHTGSAGQLVDLSIPAPERALLNTTPKANVTRSQIDQCLSALDEHADEYQSWVRVGMALYHQFDGDFTGFEYWNEWSQESGKYNAEEMQTKWRSFQANILEQRPVTFASVIQMARQAHRIKSEAAKPKDLSKFSLIHARDVVAKLGPVDWLVEDFFERDTTGLIFGDPAAYKSFIALDVAFHVAAGKPWHGRDVKQGSVIYIAGEGHNGLARRFCAWARHHNTDIGTLPVYVSEQAAQFYDLNSAQEVVETVRQLAERTETPSLIVIDTLARNFGPGDENSTADTNVFINHVDGLLRAEFGATIMVVHHTGHSNKQRARGSAALTGALGFEFRLEKGEVGMQTTLTCTKMKDAREPKDMWFEGREIVVGTFGEDDATSLVFEEVAAPVAEEKPELKGKQLALFELIKTEAPADRDVLRNIVLEDGLFENAAQFRGALHELLKKEVIVENEGRVNLLDAFFDEEQA